MSEALDKFENAVIRHCSTALDEVTYYVDEDRDHALVPLAAEVSRTRKELLRVIQAAK